MSGEDGVIVLHKKGWRIQDHPKTLLALLLVALAALVWLRM